MLTKKRKKIEKQNRKMQYMYKNLFQLKPNNGVHYEP